MNELKVINEQEVLGVSFRVYGTVDDPLFLAKDICIWLEMDVSNASKLTKSLDEEDYMTTRYNNTSATFLTEDGLYEVLMQSRKPIAKQFKKEVKVILKQIRKTGGYIPVKEEDDELTIMSKALMISQKTIEKKDELIVNLTNQIEESKPYVVKAKAIENTTDGIMVGNYARLLKNANINFGRTELFAWLRNKGYLLTQTNEKNNPKERWLKQGIFTLDQSFQNGRLVQTTMITGKGQLYLLDKIVEDLDIEYISISKMLKDFVNTYIANGVISSLEAKLMMLCPDKYEELWESIREMAQNTELDELVIEIDDILELEYFAN